MLLSIRKQEKKRRWGLCHLEKQSNKTKKSPFFISPVTSSSSTKIWDPSAKHPRTLSKHMYLLSWKSEKNPASSKGFNRVSHIIYPSKPSSSMIGMSSCFEGNRNMDSATYYTNSTVKRIIIFIGCHATRALSSALPRIRPWFKSHSLADKKEQNKCYLM